MLIQLVIMGGVAWYAKSRLSKSPAKKEPDENAEKKALGQNIVITGSALACSGLSLLYPPLALFTLLGVGYCSIYIFIGAYMSIIKKKKVDTYVTASLFAVIMMLTRRALILDLVYLVFFSAEKFLLKLKDDTDKNMTDFLAEQPKSVWVKRDGLEVSVSIESLKPGDIVVVASGEIIPIDGVIIEGVCSVDQHILTGEAQPVEKGVGDSVFAFTIILSGKVYVRTDESGQNTVTAQINNILTDMKNQVEQREFKADKINDKWSLPLLLLSTPYLLSGRIPQGLNILVSGPTMGFRMTNSVTLLNFLKVLSGHHIFVKDGRALESLTEVDTIVFDKTGTLTLDTPSVGNVYSFGKCSKDTILSCAAAAEQRQSHPIAQAILEEARNCELTLPVIDDSHYELGLGIKAVFDGKEVLVGSMSFIVGAGVPIPRALKTIQKTSHHQGYSLVIVAIGNQLGAIELHPTIRPEAPDVIRELNKNYSLYIMSGDHKEPTRKMAETLNIDHYFAEVLPQDKARLIKNLKEEGRLVCFIGDGINDSIALKEADVSISLEGASTIAVNTANIIMTKGTLKGLPLLFDVTQEYKENNNHGLLIMMIPNSLNLVGTILLGWGPFIGFSIYAVTLGATMIHSHVPLIKNNKRLKEMKKGSLSIVEK